VAIVNAPRSANFPLFDAFFVEIQGPQSPNILWILQMTTSYRHRGSAEGYKKIREIVSMLKTPATTHDASSISSTPTPATAGSASSIPTPAITHDAPSTSTPVITSDAAPGQLGQLERWLGPGLMLEVGPSRLRIPTLPALSVRPRPRPRPGPRPRLARQKLYLMMKLRSDTSLSYQRVVVMRKYAGTSPLVGTREVVETITRGISIVWR
jgi:hypothetical protein